MATIERNAELGQQIVEDALLESENNEKKSIADDRRRWRLHLAPFFGDRRAAEIDGPCLTKYIKKRKDAGAMNATVNRELALLRHAFRLALDNKRVHSVPKFKMLIENNVRPGFLKDSSQEKLVESTTAHRNCRCGAAEKQKEAES